MLNDTPSFAPVLLITRNVVHVNTWPFAGDGRRRVQGLGHGSLMADLLPTFSWGCQYWHWYHRTFFGVIMPKRSRPSGQSLLALDQRVFRTYIRIPRAGSLSSHHPFLSAVAFGVGDMSAGPDRHPRGIFSPRWLAQPRPTSLTLEMLFRTSTALIGQGSGPGRSSLAALSAALDTSVLVPDGHN